MDRDNLAQVFGVERPLHYSWASDEVKKETMWRGWKTLEEAFQKDLVKGGDQSQRVNNGILWVGDDQDNEKARFIWRYY